MGKIKPLFNLSSSLPFSSRKLCPFISHKSISSSIQETTEKDPNNSKSIPQDFVPNQADIVENLLARRKDPNSALEYFKGFEIGRGFVPGIGDSLCVLLHILVSSEPHHRIAIHMLNNHLSSASAPNVIDIIDALVSCREKLGFGLNFSLFNYVLNAYVRARRYDDAKKCYNWLASQGIVPSVSILNFYLSSLIKAGMNDEARGLFRDIVSKGGKFYDRVTVNRMMCLSLKENKIEEAIRYFKDVKRSGIKLDTLVYSSAVRAACMKKDIRYACALLSEMRGRSWVPSEGTYKNVICACVNKNNMKEALRLKDEMIAVGRSMSMVVATSLMKGYFQQGDPNSALALFGKSVKDGFVPSMLTYAVLIEGCCAYKKVMKAQQLYMRMKLEGIRPTVSVLNCLMQGYLQTNIVDEAMEIFDDVVESGMADVFTYNILMSWFSAEGRIDDAIKVWDKMMDKGVSPNIFSYNHLITANCRKGNLDAALELLSEMAAKNFKADVFTYSILIDGYFRKGEIGAALDTFEQMVMSGIAPNDVIYNAVINGLSKGGQPATAKDRMNQFMALGFTPTCKIYNSIINGFVKRGDINSALAVFWEMCKCGVSPNVITYTTLIDGLCRAKQIDIALEMRREMHGKGIAMDLIAYSALINAFCKKHDMKSACELFDEMLQVGLSPTTFVYNTMIVGFIDLPNIEAALDWKKRMECDGVQCDLVTYTSLIRLFLKDGNVQSASELCQEILAKGMKLDATTYEVLVRGLCRKGQIENAQKLLNVMDKDNITPSIYNTIISGCFRKGDLLQAFKYHDEMLDRGLVPDDKTYDLLMSRNIS